MSDFMSIEEFNDQLGDLVGSALLNRLPAFRIASMLLQASIVIAAGFEINPDNLLANLNDFTVGMSGGQCEHLH